MKFQRSHVFKRKNKPRREPGPEQQVFPDDKTDYDQEIYERIEEASSEEPKLVTVILMQHMKGQILSVFKNFLFKVKFLS